MNGISAMPFVATGIVIIIASRQILARSTLSNAKICHRNLNYQGKKNNEQMLSFSLKLNYIIFKHIDGKMCGKLAPQFLSSRPCLSYMKGSWMGCEI